MEIPIKPLEIQRTNGFFSNLGNEASIRQLRQFVRSAGLTDEPFLVPYTVQSLGFGDSLQKGIEAVKTFFSDTRVIATQKSCIEFAVTELHCPRAAGVKAKLAVTRETEEEQDFSIEILGIGGSDEFTTTFSVGNEIETSDGACIVAIYSIMAVFESCEIDTPDRQVRRFVRLKNLEPNTTSVTGKRLLDTADACQTTDFATPTSIPPEPFRFKDFAPATFTEKLSLAKGSKWKGKAKIKLDQLGIDFGAAYKGSRTHKTELEYTLVGGFDYLAVKPDNHISWLWQVTTS
jgi:hypothetical protein